MTDVLRRIEVRRGRPISSLGELLERASQHGVLGPILDELGDDPVADELVRTELVARALDHDAQLVTLAAIDDALARAGIPAVTLKGALLARRLYRRPELRPSSDIDLLVGPTRLERAREVLLDLGYTWEASPRESWYRREHHHLHLEHPSGMPLELHFDAYRGFGTRLPGDELIAASVPAEGFRALRTLQVADELVYLAVHAAAHRFERLGWTQDIAFLLRGMSKRDLDEADARARRWGVSNVLAFAVDRAGPLLEASVELPRPLTVSRRVVARLFVDEPPGRWRRGLSRVAYALSLCEDLRTSAECVAVTLRNHGH